MRGIILAAAMAALSCVSALAEGYQINSLSAKQIGMGHTGIAMKLGSENMYFNPAGMAFMNKTFDLSGSITGICSEAKAKTDGATYETANKVATPMSFNAAFSVYDNFKAGISFFTPYGSSIDWGDNWPGAVLNQNVSLKVFTIQPTLAWAITPKLSVGAGAMISWGTVDLNKALVSASTADKTIALLKSLGQLPASAEPFGNTSPASVNLTGSADLVVGFNVGAMYDITDNLTVGASYRSKMSMRVKSGNAYVRYVNSLAQNMLGETLDLLDEANFKAEMPCPWVLGLGVSYKPVKALTLAFDARLTGWKSYRQLDIEFLSDQLRPYDQHIEKNYSNAWCFSMGAQYALTNRFDLRAGLMIDTTPVSDQYYNPETPGMTKIEPSVGFSFRPVPSVSIDLGLMYVAALGRKNAQCSYADLLGAQMVQRLSAMGMTPAQIQGLGFSATGHFSADYSLHAFIPAFGISYSF